MAATSADVATLLVAMIKKPLGLVLTTAQVPCAEMEPYAPEHLHDMNSLEEKGVLCASGPFLVPGHVVGNGLTIFNVAAKEDVHRFMAEEPLEGRIGIELLLSQSRVVLG